MGSPRLKICIVVLTLLFKFDAAGQLRTKIYTGKVEYEVYSTDFYNTSESQRSTFVLEKGLYQRGVLTMHDHMIMTTRYLDQNGIPSAGLEMTGGTAIPVYDPMDIGAIRKYVRKPLPQIVVDGTVVEPLFDVVVDSTVIPGNVDEMTVATFSYPPGLQVTVKNYAFYNVFHSDYIISEISVKLTRNIEELPGSPDYPEQTVEGVTWSTSYNFGPTEAGERSQDLFNNFMGDEWAAAFPDAVPMMYSAFTGRNGLFISYTWDDDNTQSPVYDVGDPSPTTGEFLGAAVAGFAFLYADREPAMDTAGYELDDPSQPYSVGWFSYRDHNRTGQLASHVTIPGIHLPRIFNDPNADPTTEGRLGNYQSIGPYTFDQDLEELHAVYALGCASFEKDDAMALGSQWLAGEISPGEQKEMMRTVLRDSLAEILSRANWAFNETSDGKERFTVPPAPPSPSVAVASGDHKITIGWEDLSSTVANFLEYRVYRAKGSYQDLFDMVFQSSHSSDPKITEYIDENVVLGNEYYYYVTIVASSPDSSQLSYEPLYHGMVESSPFINRTTVPAIPMDLGKETVDDILVVPNPWHIMGGAYNYGSITDRLSNNQLTFVNLPPYCRLRIFNLRGELVFDKMHMSGSGTDFWNQITSSNQEIASGIYLLHVSEAYGFAKEEMGESQEKGRKLPDRVVKFIVVR